MVEVGEIDRKSLLKSEITGALGSGGTSASFHTRGTLTTEKEAFRMSAMGAAKISAYSLRTQLGMSSGPHARKVLTSLSFLATDCSVTTIGTSRSHIIGLNYGTNYNGGLEQDFDVRVGS